MLTTVPRSTGARLCCLVARRRRRIASPPSQRLRGGRAREKGHPTHQPWTLRQHGLCSGTGRGTRQQTSREVALHAQWRARAAMSAARAVHQRAVRGMAGGVLGATRDAVLRSLCGGVGTPYVASRRGSVAPAGDAPTLRLELGVAVGAADGAAASACSGPARSQSWASTACADSRSAGGAASSCRTSSRAESDTPAQGARWNSESRRGPGARRASSLSRLVSNKW